MKFSVRGLTKHFSSYVAVNNLNFDITNGDVVAFVGPNGAGKTTTLRILSTLSLPTAGNAFVDGHSIITEPEYARKHIGFVPDSLDDQDGITIHDYLDFYARLYGFKRAQREELIDGIEEFTNLTSIRDKFTNVLSKGMKQRVSIARALINDPTIILMDEPAAGLDPRARIELRELISILAQRDKIILISSHILTELSEICNSALIIEKGRQLKFGKINEILKESEEAHGKGVRSVVITPAGDSKVIVEKLLLSPKVTNVQERGSFIEFDYEGENAEISSFIMKLMADGCQILEFKLKRSNLETVFMDVTKGEVQ